MDYRFKIAGGNQPFNVELSAGTTSICQQVVDFPNTCVFFKELGVNTTYTYKITDAVNRVTGCTFTTFPTQVSPAETPIKRFTVLGEVTNPLGRLSQLSLHDDKCLSISPPLGFNDCVEIQAKACLYADDINVNNSVTFYKGCDGQAPQYLIEYNANGIKTPPPIMLCYGDTICYNMSTVGGSAAGVYEGCACIWLESVTKCGGDFTPVRDSNSGLTTSVDYTISTTTTSTTPSPTVISFREPIAFNLVNNCCVATAKLTASPSLTSEQCVEMCFTDCSIVCARQNLSYDACAGGRVYNGSSNVATISAQVDGGQQGGDNCGCFKSVVLTSDNISDVTIYLCACLNQFDYTKDVYTCSYFIFNRFDKQCCGTYTFGGGGNVGSGTIQIDRTGTASAGVDNEDLVPLRTIRDQPSLPTEL